jgi:glucan biosynthesis protein C
MDERRYYGLDALRGGMMMLGIVLHAAWMYLAEPPPAMPMVTDRNTSVLFDIVFAFIHSFRMPAFFVVAGFFAALLVEKRGVAGTLKDRALRVLAPLVACAFTILPLTGLFMFDFILGAQFGVRTWIPDAGSLQAIERVMLVKGAPPGQVPLAHLWFLYYLCYFYLLVPLWRALAARALPHRDRVNAWLASPWTLVALSLYTAATLWPFHGGQVHEGFIFLKPHLPSLAYYGSFFVLGYFLHQQREFLMALAKHVPLWAGLSLVLFPLATWMSALDNATRGADHVQHLYAVLANGACTWALIYLFVGCAQRFFDRESPWIQYTSQSAYWVYLVHMPLVLLAAFWLTRYDLPAEVKFLLVCAFATVFCFLSFHYLVQKTWVSGFLHGRRFDLAWPWNAPRHEAVAGAQRGAP